ncbi:stalk domain-containing protein [Paenibacillus thalictri]|uniref:stalk domain-containing protein n=1 Tax=Paenibacillus thalictri TaxID=2527873 RepID=UPI0013EF2C64|nr:stalk domain-containing protein [Paenibacillus thalictri]
MTFKWAIAIIAALSLSSALPSVASAAQSTSPQVVFNGEVIFFEQTPFMQGETLYVPMRSFLEKLGFEVAWEASAGSVTATNKELKLEFRPGSAIVLVNGIVTDIGYVTLSKEDSLWIPLQPLITLIGGRTVWNPLSQTVYVKPDLATYIINVLQNEADRLTYEGDTRFALKQGAGKLFLDGQLWYEGLFTDNQLDGVGQIYENGRLLYDGTFQNNMPSGSGTLTYSNGDTYTGQFAGGKPQGSGTYSIRGKIAYSGDWKDGTMDGFGRLYTSDGKSAFEGGFVRNQRTGYGVSFNENGNKSYEGNWKNGLKDGQGKSFDKDGKIEYEGGWKNDKKEGSGTTYMHYAGNFLTTSGEKVLNTVSEPAIEIQKVRYVGDRLLSSEDKFVYRGPQSGDGLPHGLGELLRSTSRSATEKGVIRNNQIYYEGDFVYGEMTGRGILYDNSGNPVYEGEMVKGVRQGQGILYTGGVVYYEGGWYEGKESGTGRIYKYDSEFTGPDFAGRAGVYMFEGQYTAGKLVKNGNIYKYYGPFSGGKAEGFGHIVLLYDLDSETRPSLPLLEKTEGKLLYEGDFKNGLREGKGKQYKDYQLVYDGDYKKGVKEGTGKYYENSTVYEGPFVNDVRSGKGIVTNRYGSKIYEGEYKNDMKNGYGKQYDDFGKLAYEGEFKSDLRHGYGKLYNSDGETTYYEGEFREDKLLADWLRDR